MNTFLFRIHDTDIGMLLVIVQVVFVFNGSRNENIKMLRKSYSFIFLRLTEKATSKNSVRNLMNPNRVKNRMNLGLLHEDLQGNWGGKDKKEYRYLKKNEWNLKNKKGTETP